MGTIRKDFKYKIVKNFLTKDEVKLFTHYCEIKHRTNTDSFDRGKMLILNIMEMLLWNLYFCLNKKN